MTLTWTFRDSFNIAFGETSVLFGILFIGTSISLAKGWELITLAIYGFFAGLVAVLVGVRLIKFGIDATTYPFRYRLHLNGVSWNLCSTNTFVLQE